jgi:hypothetical protein
VCTVTKSGLVTKYDGTTVQLPPNSKVVLTEIKVEKDWLMSGMPTKLVAVTDKSVRNMLKHQYPTQDVYILDILIIYHPAF